MKNKFSSLIVSFFFGQTLGIRVYPVCISTKGTTVADGTIAENFNGFFLLFTSLIHWYKKWKNSATILVLRNVRFMLDQMT